jgi:hypothetical protein
MDREVRGEGDHLPTESVAGMGADAMAGAEMVWMRADVMAVVGMVWMRADVMAVVGMAGTDADAWAVVAMAGMDAVAQAMPQPDVAVVPVVLAARDALVVAAEELAPEQLGAEDCLQMDVPPLGVVEGVAERRIPLAESLVAPQTSPVGHRVEARLLARTSICRLEHGAPCNSAPTGTYTHRRPLRALLWSSP